MDDRLPTKLYVQGHLKQCELRGVFFYILQAGDPDSGVVNLKINLMNGKALCLVQTRDEGGAMAWLQPLGTGEVNEADADAYFNDTKQFDPDAWLIEIESPDGWHPFTEKTLSDGAGNVYL